MSRSLYPVLLVDTIAGVLSRVFIFILPGVLSSANEPKYHMDVSHYGINTSVTKHTGGERLSVQPHMEYFYNPKHFTCRQAMLDQRDFTGKAALHHAVTDMEERHQVLQALLAAKAQVQECRLNDHGPHICTFTVKCQFHHRREENQIMVTPFPYG